MPSAAVRAMPARFLASTAKPSSFKVDQGVHAYRCPAGADVRGVCPALNTLSNHGYLPHDGKDITFSTLAHALHVGYGISPGFANFLVLGSYLLLKRDPLRSLDLREIARRGCIEHSASIVHNDSDGAMFAPAEVNLDLLHKFLNKAYSPPDIHASDDDAITVEDIAHTRIAREAVSAPINALHAEIARGEFAMVLDIFGKGSEKTLSKEEMDVWLNENRFPEGWAPTHAETLANTRDESTKMRELMQTYRGSIKPELYHSLWSSIEKTTKELFDAGETVHDTNVKAVSESDEKLGLS